MSLIVQASRKANEFAFTQKEQKILNRNIEALKFSDLSSRLNASSASAAVLPTDSSLDTLSAERQQQLRLTDSNTLLSDFNKTTFVSSNLDESIEEHPRQDANDAAAASRSVVHKRPKKPTSFYSIVTKLFRLAFSNVGLIAAVFIYSTLGALMFQLLEQHEELRLCEGKGKFLKELKQCRENIILYVIYNSSTNQLSSLSSTSTNQTRSTRSSRNPRSVISTLSPSTRLNNEDLVTANYSLESFWATSKPAKIAAADAENITRTTNKNSSKPHDLNDLLKDIKLNDLNNEDNYYPLINSLLIEFRRKVIEIQLNTSYYGQDCVLDSKWSLFSALLFTITTISTVGYGHVTPLTWEGRVVCVCYASMGIPIFLMCLTHLSSALGKMFKFIYAKFDSINPVGKFLKRRRREAKLKRRAKRRKMMGLSTDNSDKSPKNVVVLQDGQSILTKSDLSSNMAAVTAAVAVARERDMDEFNLAYELHLTDDDDNLSDDEDDDEDEDDYLYEAMEGEVPVSLAICVIVLYMAGGGWLFHKFEGWTFTQSFYFAFVSLTTMGFGDLVPGQKRNDKYANLKQLTICFYSLFGMAIIGMCFSVMQFVARRKIMWLFSRLKQISSCCKKRKQTVSAETDGSATTAEGQIRDVNNLTETLIEREREKETILNRLKLLQQYENAISAKRRRRHVLS